MNSYGTFFEQLDPRYKQVIKIMAVIITALIVIPVLALFLAVLL